MQYHNSPEWQRYLELKKERPGAFAAGALDIITDHDRVDAFYERTGKKLGVMYESPFHLLVVDLVSADPEGDCFAYERLLPAVEHGAIVAVAKSGDDYILLRQFRHAPRRSMLAFPRGFGEPGLPARDNAKKELREELRIPEPPDSDVHYLGRVTADSGILSTEAEVFLCEVEPPSLRSGYEGIEGLCLVSASQLDEMIRRGDITDGYTLAAWSLYRTQR